MPEQVFSSKRLVTVTFGVTRTQVLALARRFRCDRAEVGTVLLDRFIRQVVTNAFDREVAKAPSPQIMTITRKKRRHD